MLEKVREKVWDLLNEEDSGHGMEHIERVLKLSLAFAKKEGANQEVVSLIALLHDADDYKLFGMDNAKNLTNTKRIMNECHVDKSIQEQVCLALHNIGYSKRLGGCMPTTIEAKIVSDADMCDGIGAVGILRAHQFGIKIGRPFFVRDSFPLENNSPEYHMKKTSSTINFILEALFKYKDIMLTDSGREESNKRHQRMIDFLYNFFQEENAPEWIDILNKYSSES